MVGFCSWSWAKAGRKESRNSLFLVNTGNKGSNRKETRPSDHKFNLKTMNVTQTVHGLILVKQAAFRDEG
jgi:hypothetical protein